jgi:hypothetical protein
MISNTNLIVHTSILVAIEFLTFCFISFQLLTPMIGALFLVNITTSSTKVRAFGPIGPLNFSENAIGSFGVPVFVLLLATEKPFDVLHSYLLPPPN